MARRRCIPLFGVLLLTQWFSFVEAKPSFPLPGATLVEGRQVPFFLHRPLVVFRVYAFHGDTPVPILFQIDERDHRERWVLEHGPKQNLDDRPGELDDNDVVVIMNRDLGRRGDVMKLPAGAKTWAEIRTGSVTDPRGFAYVGAFDQPQPLACAECASTRYDEATDRVYAERYALEFRAPLPKHVAFVEKMGEFGVNAVAGVRAAGEVRFLGGLLTLRKTDADIHTELLGYRNGPVRVIRRARYWIPLPFGFRTAGRVDLLFYRDFVEGTALLKIGIPPSLVLADGELHTYFNFLSLDGARLLLEGEAPSDPVDGRTTPAKQALAGRPARWAALLLPEGRTVLLVVRLEGALQRLDQRLYFQDKAEEDGGTSGRPFFGFAFAKMNRLETGTHRLSVFASVLDSVDPQEIRSAVNFFLSPPEITASLIQQ